MMLITDGIAGAAVWGALRRGDGPATTVWTTLRQDGEIAVTLAADTDNGGLAVTAQTAGTWVCRSVSAPE